MKIFPCLLFVLNSYVLFPQVGIGTSNPKAQLDVVATSQENPTEIDGILIPRVNKFPTNLPTKDQHGMLVFLNLDNANEKAGFYYWNSLENKWKSINQETVGGNFYKVGTTSSPNTISDLIFREGGIGIGTDQLSSKLQIAINPGKDLAIKKTLEVDNNNSSTDNLTTYGIVNDNRSATNGNKYGIKTNVGGIGTGIHYGIFNETYQNTGTNDIYGIFNRVGRTFGARSNNYGIYSEIGSIQGVGNIYGIYSVAYGDSNSNVFAGYFAGRVGIGATSETDYVLPVSRGTEGQVLSTNGNGQAFKMWGFIIKGHKI